MTQPLAWRIRGSSRDAFVFSFWRAVGNLEVGIPRWRARSVTETVTSFSLSAPHFPFIPFSQCLCTRQSNHAQLRLIGETNETEFSFGVIMTLDVTGKNRGALDQR